MDDDPGMDASCRMSPVPEEVFYRLTVHLVGGFAIMRDYSGFFEARRDARDLTEPLSEGIVKEWCDDYDNEVFVVAAKISAVCVEQLPPCNDFPPFLGRFHWERTARLHRPEWYQPHSYRIRHLGNTPQNNTDWL